MVNNFGLEGIGPNVQFGKTGLRLKDSGTDFEFRDNADAAFVNVSVATPTINSHAATKEYVDSFVQGLDFKASVLYGTAAPLPANSYANGTGGVGATLTALANGALTVDGSVVSLNDRILVKDEANTVHNGIYSVTQVGSGSTPYILTRSVDADEDIDVSGGMFVFIEDGTVNADTGWVLSEPNGQADIGVDNLEFVQFSSAGVITVGAGSALDKISNELSVRVDGSTIGINGVGNGQLIVRSTATAGQVLVSTGADGNAAVWNFIEDLRHPTTGRLIIDGADAGGANTNFLRVTTSNAGAPGTVTIAATNAGIGGDAADVNLVLDPKGLGNIVAGATITTETNTNLVLDPNGTGNIVVGATITTLGGADLILDPAAAGIIRLGAELSTQSNANLILNPDGTGIIETGANIDLLTDSIVTSTSNGDIKLLPDGTGVVSVSGTTNYETNVTDDDDIPNKKYVDDAITNAAGGSARRTVVSADSINDTFNIGAALPTLLGKDTYVTEVKIHVTTAFSGGSVNRARIFDGTNILMTFDENDILVTGTYVVELPVEVNSEGNQLVIEFYESDGVTPAVPTGGAAIVFAEFVSI